MATAGSEIWPVNKEIGNKAGNTVNLINVHADDLCVSFLWRSGWWWWCVYRSYGGVDVGDDDVCILPTEERMVVMS